MTDTIKTVTHCPTCNSEVRVEGRVTHHHSPIHNTQHYVPITDELRAEIAQLQAERLKLIGKDKERQLRAECDRLQAEPASAKRVIAMARAFREAVHDYEKTGDK